MFPLGKSIREPFDCYQTRAVPNAQQFLFFFLRSLFIVSPPPEALAQSSCMRVYHTQRKSYFCPPRENQYLRLFSKNVFDDIIVSAKKNGEIEINFIKRLLPPNTGRGRRRTENGHGRIRTYRFVATVSPFGFPRSISEHENDPYRCRPVREGRRRILSDAVFVFFKLPTERFRPESVYIYTIEIATTSIA